MYKIGDNVYIPVDVIRYVFFKEGAPIVRKEDSEYEILGQFQYGLAQFDQLPDYLKNPHNYKSEIDLDKNFQLILNRFLITEDFGTMSSYEDYFINLFKVIDSQEDYHSYIMLVEEIVSKEKLEVLGFEDVLNESFLKKLNDRTKEYYNTNEISFKINNENAYIKIDSFDIEEQNFKSNINKFIAELSGSGVQNIILDLRNNLGGKSINSTYLLNYLLDQDLIVRFNSYVDGEYVGNQVVNFSRELKIKRNYNISVLINNNSMSSSIIVAHLLKENSKTEIIGQEPEYKETGSVTIHQSLNGTIFYTSSDKYKFIDSNGDLVDETPLVDIKMDNDEIEKYLIDIQIF